MNDIDCGGIGGYAVEVECLDCGVTLTPEAEPTSWLDALEVAENLNAAHAGHATRRKIEQVMLD